jgi:hypothetical protein
LVIGEEVDGSLVVRARQAIVVADESRVVVKQVRLRRAPLFAVSFVVALLLLLLLLEPR